MFAVFLLVLFILIGGGVAAWASNEYGSSSNSFYVVIGAYTLTAFILFVVLMVLLGGIFGDMGAPVPPEGSDVNQVDTDTNTDGMQGQQLFNIAAVSFVGYFAYKFMALKKAAAARATSTEGKDDVMLYTANGMDWLNTAWNTIRAEIYSINADLGI